MREYETNEGVKCTEEENKLINSLKRLAKQWDKYGNDLMLFSWAGTLCVVKKSCIDDRCFETSIVERIFGICNDGGDPN